MVFPQCTAALLFLAEDSNGTKLKSPFKTNLWLRVLGSQTVKKLMFSCEYKFIFTFYFILSFYLT